MEKECHNIYEEMYERKQFTWSDGVKKGKIIAISGSVATDMNHRTVHAGDLEAQVRYIYESVKKLLEKMGASMDDVIKTTDYIAPEAVPDYLKTAAIRREYFRKGSYPAATGVVVHSLLRPDWLIEIDFLAVVD
ncbi:MAG: RidA family protein [Syntrophorhabdus sp.]|jgi:enamine deaminase RidA (YjgF/YER057c/UK114 family)|nr:RidA family protein [Syntrophorhabdus sp.]